MSDANPYTTAEVLKSCPPGHYPDRGGEREHRDRLLATTRELEDWRGRLGSLAATYDLLSTGCLARAVQAEIERDEARERLASIVDEEFGLQEVLGFDDLLTRLEHLLHERGTKHRAALREIDATRASVAELVAALKPLCHPGTSGRSVVDWERARAALEKAKGGAP